jgi:hypothetical protein
LFLLERERWPRLDPVVWFAEYVLAEKEGLLVVNLVVRLVARGARFDGKYGWRPWGAVDRVGRMRVDEGCHALHTRHAYRREGTAPTDERRGKG